MPFPDVLAAGDEALREILGGPVTYAPGAGDPVEVVGIFTAPHTAVDPESQGGGISTVSPTVFLKLSDLPSNPEVDPAARVTVAGVTYSWHDSQPDGLGGILLLLHKVA